MCNVDQILKAFNTLRCPKCGSKLLSRGPGYMCTSRICGWWATWRDVLERMRQDNDRFWVEYRKL